MTLTGRQKTRNHGYDIIVGGELLLITRSPSQTCHAKPKTQINRRRTLPASFRRWWDAYRKQLGLKDFSPKVRTLALQQIKERGGTTAYDWSWWPCQAIDRYLNIWASLPGAGYLVSSSIRLTAWLPNSKKRAERSREIDVWASHRDYLRSGYHHHRLPVMRGNVTVITPITYKAPARQKCGTEAGERGNYWHTNASAWCCYARCKIHEGVIDAKAENDTLRDDVAAGRRRLHIKQSCQSVRWPPPPPAWIMQPPRLADTAERDYFTLKRLITMQKQLEGTQKYINEQCR